MKTKITKFTLILFFIISFAQSQTNQSATAQQKQVSENVIYQLFPTQNIWTFIKLDTRNGKMWQVHFSISTGEFEGQLDLNSTPLVSEVEETKGRFTLYKTENTYNFILLDQIDGKVWQVQWNSKQELRGITRIY